MFSITRSSGAVTPGIGSGTTFGGMSVLSTMPPTQVAFPVAKTPPPPATVYQVTSE